LGIIPLTAGVNTTSYCSCNYFACCSGNYSQIGLESNWLPIQSAWCHYTPGRGKIVPCNL